MPVPEVHEYGVLLAAIDELRDELRLGRESREASDAEMTKSMTQLRTDISAERKKRNQLWRPIALVAFGLVGLATATWQYNKTDQDKERAQCVASNEARAVIRDVLEVVLEDVPVEVREQLQVRLASTLVQKECP